MSDLKAELHRKLQASRAVLLSYLGESFGHPAPETMSWIEDGSVWQGADMRARPDESSEYIIGLYRRACAHADHVIAALDLEAPGSVPHWPADRRNTTLSVLLVLGLLGRGPRAVPS